MGKYKMPRNVYEGGFSYNLVHVAKALSLPFVVMSHVYLQSNVSAIEL